MMLTHLTLPLIYREFFYFQSHSWGCLSTSSFQYHHHQTIHPLMVAVVHLFCYPSSSSEILHCTTAKVVFYPYCLQFFASHPTSVLEYLAFYDLSFHPDPSRKCLLLHNL